MSVQTKARFRVGQQASWRSAASLCWGLALLSASGCLGLNPPNDPPVARARVLVNGEPLAATASIPFDGTPIAIVLDGSESSDSDGKIAAFVWRRTDVPAFQRYGLDAGTGETAAPAFSGDPAEGAMSQATLTERGDYRFSLWVRDNDGGISKPASVSVKVGGYMPDAACVAAFAEPRMDCQACTCTPNAMDGCLDEVNRCFNNADAQFSMLCSAVVNCAVAKGCSGTACYTAANCMAEIDAAAGYMGGSVATCSMFDMADANPCAASGALANCQAMSMCSAACQ